MQSRSTLLAFTIVALLTLFGGCAARDPVARARMHPGFAGRPAGQRESASTGRVRDGMSAEAVRVAWGDPTVIYHGRAQGRALEAWVYLRPMPSKPGPEFGRFPAVYDAARRDFLTAYYREGRFDNRPGAVVSRFCPGAIFYPGPVPPSLEQEQPILDRQAVFENGRVVRHASVDSTGP